METNTKENETNVKAIFGSKRLIFVVLGIVGLLVLLIGGFFVWKKLSSLTSPLNAKPNPLKVTFTTNEKATTKVIDAAGGVVSLEGEGAKFALNVPKDGVFQSESITLKQIKSIDGMGQGATFVAGVQALPAGTTFLSGADLTFDVPLNGKVAGFAFEEDGKNFHLYPLQVKDGKATLSITGFSGYGIISVGDGSYTPPTPDSIEARAKQLIEKIILEGQAESGSLSENQKERIYNLMNVWYKLSIKPDLDKSVNNDDLVIPAFERFKDWLAAAQLLGLEDRFANEREASFDTSAKATKNSYEKASKRCNDQKDASQIAKMTKLAKFAMKWGLNHRQGLNADDLMEKTKKCAVFELHINSTTSFPKYGQSINASGVISIGMDSDYNLVGDGVIKQNSYENEGFVCSYTSGGMPSFPVKVVSTKLDVSSNNPKASLMLQFEDVENTLVCHSATPDVDFTSTDHGDDWLTDFFIIYHDDGYLDPGIFTISGWEIVNSDGIYAKKIMNRDKFIDNGHPELNYTLHENTTYELKHTPR